MNSPLNSLDTLILFNAYLNIMGLGNRGEPLKTSMSIEDKLDCIIEELKTLNRRLDNFER